MGVVSEGGVPLLGVPGISFDVMFAPISFWQDSPNFIQLLFLNLLVQPPLRKVKTLSPSLATNSHLFPVFFLHFVADFLYLPLSRDDGFST